MMKQFYVIRYYYTLTSKFKSDFQCESKILQRYLIFSCLVIIVNIQRIYVFRNPFYFSEKTSKLIIYSAVGFSYLRMNIIIEIILKESIIYYQLVL